MLENASNFRKQAEKLRQRVSEFENPLIITHYDGDGLSSGSIASIGFEEHFGKNVQVKVVKRIDEPLLQELKEKGLQPVFTDFGSGMLNIIEKYFSEKEAAIIDHHELEKKETFLMQLNCHEFGFDGGIDATAASSAYFVFPSKRTIKLAIVGTVADMQDQKGFQGINAEMLKDAKEKYGVTVKTDLKLFGKYTRPLVNFLSYSNDPYLPKLSGSDRGSALFLIKNEIAFEKNEGGEEKIIHYADLNPETKKRLQNALIEHGLKFQPQEKVNAIIGDCYFFEEIAKNELDDAYEFSTLLNACGRNGRPEVGIALCKGENGALEEARNVYSIHRSNIRRGLAVARSKTNDFGPFYFLDGRNAIMDTIIGTVAGSILTSLPKDKPIIAYSIDENGKTKVSGRCSKTAAEKGVNLAALMKEASRGFGEGGGHQQAAGCTIEKGHEEEFLKNAKEIIKKQTIA